MRKKLKTLTVLLPMVAVSVLLGSCAATSCNGVTCQAREISSVGDKDEDSKVWEHRPYRPKLRGEY